ncbi:dehydrogenase/reductase SDR family member on chromosome X-like, partial [Liolophura sinensis]|uniref:dehydrogenase/reductase SDR family member on chromosome X-like n=1 Tax=Liolophura sinensis TaxID=3198878 RepID=UPI003158F048
MTAGLPADLTGRVVIVTGGATGIGKEVTIALASRKATVVIASKDIDMMEQTVACINQQNPEARVEYMVLNLASFGSIQGFVKKFTNSYSQLDILINNAGVMLTPYSLTEEGYEQHMGVNYLGHGLLTFLLLDTLQKSGSPATCARIINVTSSTHLVADTYIHTWFDSKPYSFSSHEAYANSKLAILMS